MIINCKSSNLFTRIISYKANPFIICPPQLFLLLAQDYLLPHLIAVQWSGRCGTVRQLPYDPSPNLAASQQGAVGVGMLRASREGMESKE